MNIVGEYLIEVILPAVLTNYFELLFQNTPSVAQFNSGMFADIFHMKQTVTLSLRRDMVEAKRFSHILTQSYKKFNWSVKTK